MQSTTKNKTTVVASILLCQLKIYNISLQLGWMKSMMVPIGFTQTPRILCVSNPLYTHILNTINCCGEYICLIKLFKIHEIQYTSGKAYFFTDFKLSSVIHMPSSVRHWYLILYVILVCYTATAVYRLDWIIISGRLSHDITQYTYNYKKYGLFEKLVKCEFLKKNSFFILR